MTDWRRKVRERLAELGGTMEDDGVWDERRFQLIAPAGQVWACDGNLHSLVVSYTQGPWKDAINENWKDAYERMAYGLIKCPDAECEWCNEHTDCECDQCKDRDMEVADG